MKGEGVSSSASPCSSSLNVEDEDDRKETSSCRVLAVDDNIIDRKLIEKLLNSSSFQVTTAENGMKALQYLGLSDDQTDDDVQVLDKVDLILTDYCMPGITGYDLLKKIKESSNLKEVPVVIVSSENVPERINKCLEEGAQMFLLKPLTQSVVNKLRDLVIDHQKKV